MINKKLREQQHDVQNYRDADALWREYTRVTGKNLAPLGPRPRLSDFYTPSSAQKDREIVFIVLGMAVTGLMAYKIAR